MSNGPVGGAMVDQTFLAWQLARSRLAGLTDEEFFWEPVDRCWSLRPKTEVDGVAPHDSPGEWWIDGDGIEAPEPPPFTTIAWLIGHMTLAVWNYNDTIAGGAPAPEPALPASASAAVDLWEEVIGRFQSMVGDYSDEDLVQQVNAWGGTAARTFLVSHVTCEVLHHAAEVGRLRDLFRYRANLRV